MSLSWATVSLDFLLIMCQHYIEAWFTGHFIKARRFRLFCVLYVFLYTLGYGLFEYVFPNYKGVKAILLPVIAIVLTVLFRERPLFKSILFPALLHICLIGTDYILLFFFRTVLPEYIDVMKQIDITGNIPIGSAQFSLLILLRVAGILGIFICILLTYYLLRDFSDAKTSFDKRLNQLIPVFILEILFVGLLMVFTSRTSLEYSSVIWLMIAFPALLYVLDLLVLRMLRSVENAEQLRHEKNELELLAAANATAYNQILEGNTRFRILRHDMLNQLQTACILLERGDAAAASKQLQTYADIIRSSGKTISGNNIADAVLSIKETTCSEAGITLDVSGKLPEDLPLNNAQLCGVIGNILDNAIHAVSDTHLSAEEKRIRFSAAIRDDKLVISCKNPSSKSVETKISAPDIESEHGWGLYILNKMASDHGGAFTLTTENGIASALFWIPFIHAEVE